MDVPLVCVQLKERDFEKRLTKVDNYYAKNQFQRDVHCAKKYLGDILVF